MSENDERWEDESAGATRSEIRSAVIFSGIALLAIVTASVLLVFGGLAE